ncbi:Defender against death DAD protein [Macrophomina phaseolina MS6]|uniref:Dolichyl-diphosphooligosaccharide--protein glycosyltransferase subunit OST2 n=1 Tax=Macrophomina phaseolina (strain MS6) TaxID=1126212 RepID=K2RHX6_MACPH|nr:Defender against death DAD protein [Macrophomina phaseolina MS6]
MPPRQRTQGGNNGPASPAAVPASAADPAASVPSAASHTTKANTATSTTGPVGSSSSSSAKINSNDASAIANSVWKNYVNKTDQRTKLLDVFMVFLVAVGALQFLYCIIGGNFVSCPPFISKRLRHEEWGWYMRECICSRGGRAFGVDGSIDGAPIASEHVRGSNLDALLTVRHHSLSTPSSRASAPPWASSSSPRACASRPTPRTRATLEASPTSGTFYEAPYLNPAF